MSTSGSATWALIDETRNTANNGYGYKIVTALDASNNTDYVWQMELREEDTRIKVFFQRTRLPRSVELDFQNSIDDLETNLMKHTLVLVSESMGVLTGFLVFS